MCFKQVGCNFIIDIGTSVILGPLHKVDKLLARIGDVKEDCSNREALPTVSFEIGGRDFHLAPGDYILKRAGPSGDRCVLAIQSVRSSVPVWVLGTPFLR